MDRYLEVAVDDAALVAVLDGLDDLPELAPRQRLRHPAVARYVLCNKIQPINTGIIDYIACVVASK